MTQQYSKWESIWLDWKNVYWCTDRYVLCTFVLPTCP